MGAQTETVLKFGQALPVARARARRQGGDKSCVAWLCNVCSSRRSCAPNVSMFHVRRNKANEDEIMRIPRSAFGTKRWMVQIQSPRLVEGRGFRGIFGEPLPSLLGLHPQ